MQVRERIRLLDEQTVSQIAAGEVIERPVSVVKELVENSLDAGAHALRVELQDGGRDCITVHDDGGGIPADQLALALQRHGTSKLNSASELFSIKTLGFRGEGLASIAAAAGSIELISRPADQDFGARIQAVAGVVGPISRIAASPGTTVRAHQLFDATPVRRQFLKSERAEFARVSAFLAQLALGWPNVSFILRHEGREVWNLPAVQHAADRIEMVFGKGSRGSLLPVSYVIDRGTRITGFTAKPGNDRPNRQGQILFVNGRLIRNTQLNAAWSAGYGSMLMGGRYPYGALMLELPPGEVDVNVHPTKLEVRFLNAGGVFEAVRRALQQTLRASSPVRDMSGPLLRLDTTAAAGGTIPTTLPELAAPDVSLLENRLPEIDAIPQKARALGQIDHTYILVADSDMLLIVDQHAAHERIAYEALLAADKSESPTEPLLFPIMVELSADQASTLQARWEYLTEAGIEIEFFGDSAYRIVALPSVFGRRHIDLPGLLDDLAQTDSAFAPEEQRRYILATVACHSVVRAHDPLSLQEQIGLYEGLRQCQAPHTCPHGRPTMIQLDSSHLAKAFNRT